jgi:hypothetical protein
VSKIHTRKRKKGTNIARKNKCMKQECKVQVHSKFSTDYRPSHRLWTPNEGIHQRNLKIWADVADKICFGRT